MKKLILWGATGQSIMLYDTLHSDYELIAIFDNNRNLQSPFDNIPLLFGWEEMIKWSSKYNVDEIYFAVAIGGGNGKTRLEIHENLEEYGFTPINSINKSAYVGSNVEVGIGAQILPNSTVCPRVKIGKCSIINTSASVDHECKLGKSVHIGPGATLAGCITVGDFTFIGSNATILPNISVGKNVIIGAGSVVTKNIPDNVIAFGNPCRIIKKI